MSLRDAMNAANLAEQQALNAVNHASQYDSSGSASDKTYRSELAYAVSNIAQAVARLASEIDRRS